MVKQVLVPAATLGSMPATTARSPLITFEEAARLDPDEYPGEIDRGRWVPVTRNTWRHGELLINIGTLLRLFVREHPGWSVSGGDPGARLSREPDILRGPDIGVIRRERRPQGRGAAGWLQGAPELAIEICGDDQTPGSLAKKALEYLSAGSRAVWVVDGASEQVIVYTPPDRVKVLERDDLLDGQEALPEFRCQVAELFE